jgi:hypothetical protein
MDDGKFVTINFRMVYNVVDGRRRRRRAFSR